VSKSENYVKSPSEEWRIPRGVFPIIRNEKRNGLESIAMTPPKRRLCRPQSAEFAIVASRMAAQHAVPIAIAVAEVAAAEGRFRAVIKLIVDAAMVRAIGPAGEILRRAMVAEPRRQLRGRLPVDADDEAACRVRFAGANGRYRQGGG